MTIPEMREKFKDNPKHLRFINDMLRAKREVTVYSGRGMYGREVPAVSCELHELQQVCRETKIEVGHDTLAKGYIVYAL